MQMISSWRRLALGLAGLVAAAAMTGCVSMKPYVGANVRDVPASEYVKPNPSHAVQVLFNFQSKGVDNARVTTALKARVIDQVSASHLFDSVSEAPVPGGALLIVNVNNVMLDDNAFSKGFATGLTLGLAGSVAGDGYIATARYTPPAPTPLISKEVRHAIYTTIGNHDAPPNAVPAANMDEAVTRMLHQVVSNLLNDVSHDPAFK
jgi:hypothetical protein